MIPSLSVLTVQVSGEIDWARAPIVIPSLSVLTAQVSGEIDPVNHFALYLYTLFINTMNELG